MTRSGSARRSINERTVLRCLCALMLVFLFQSGAYAQSVTKLTMHNNWEMLNFPPLPDNETFASVLSDDLPMQEYGDTWMLFEYNSGSSNYASPDLNTTPQKGKGYWFIQTTGADLEIDVPDYSSSGTHADCSPEDLCYTIVPASAPGTETWNLLGNPFAVDRNLDAVRIRSGIVGDPCYVGCTLDEAFANNIAADVLFLWDADSQSYVNASPPYNIGLWDAFWFLTLPDSDSVRITCDYSTSAS